VAERIIGTVSFLPESYVKDEGHPCLLDDGFSDSFLFRKEKPLF
jgi:hypothetical protein